MLVKIFRCFLLGLFLLLLSGRSVLAKNIFGIHILEPTEVDKAAKLVNSSGGDWGYVTAVLRDDDLVKEKWQKFMDDCRQLHLIPLIRIATHMKENYWVKPNLADLDKWPDFFVSLTWPVKQQIVIIFNEPNQAKEWGGEINPQEYVLVLNKLITLFKQKSKNFFILNAALDQAADGRNNTLKESDFLSLMHQTNKNIFNRLDGWASHSYPNHGFVGLPEDIGRATIRGYQWELNQLKKLGLSKDLPVFITETGWPHQEGLPSNPHFYPSKKVAQLLEKSFVIWNNDNRVKAVTPFVLNHPQPPFAHFSWLKENNQAYEQYQQVLQISKGKNQPEQIKAYQIIKIKLADLLPTNYLYKGKLVIKNTGQWIMGEKDDFVLPIEFLQFDSLQKFDSLQANDLVIPKGFLKNQPLGLRILPGEEKEFEFSFKTSSNPGEKQIKIGDNLYKIYVFKPFDLKNRKISLWRQLTAWLKLWWDDFQEK